jgi:hypothetical protein
MAGSRRWPEKSHQFNIWLSIRAILAGFNSMARLAEVQTTEASLRIATPLMQGSVYTGRRWSVQPATFMANYLKLFRDQRIEITVIMSF